MGYVWDLKIKENRADINHPRIDKRERGSRYKSYPLDFVLNLKKTYQSLMGRIIEID